MANVRRAVTVFDSSITSEPFLDSVGLEKLRKRQAMETKQEEANLAR